MDKTVEDAVNHILGLSNSDENIEKLHHRLTELEDGLKSCANNELDGSPILLRAAETLTLRDHSLGVVHLVAAQTASVETKAQRDFVRVASDVLQHFDRKQVVPRGSKKLVQIAHKLTNLLSCPAFAAWGLKPLRAAAIRLAPRPSCLTPIHADFLQLALVAKYYSKAAHFLDDLPIFEVDPQRTSLPSVDLLRYYYYGGMVYIGLKRYNDALDFFRTACTVPASGLSAVVVESYKKLVLVSLLVPGRGPVVEGGDVTRLLPKYTSVVVARHVRHAASAYHEIAKAAQADVPSGLDELIDKHRDALNSDNNLGLAKQVARYVVSRNIQRLTHTYVTLSLADIAKNAKLADADTALRHILDLVRDGTISAQVDEVSGIVHFREDKQLEDLGSTQSIERLDRELQVVMQLASRMRDLDVRISTSAAYVSKVVGRGSSTLHGGGGGESSSSAPDNMPDDMMATDDYGGHVGLAFLGHAASSATS